MSYKKSDITISRKSSKSAEKVEYQPHDHAFDTKCDEREIHQQKKQW